MVSVAALHRHFVNTASMSSYMTGFDPSCRWSRRSRVSVLRCSAWDNRFGCDRANQGLRTISHQHADTRSHSSGQSISVAEDYNSEEMYNRIVTSPEEMVHCEKFDTYG